MSRTTRILLVEDDPALRETLRDVLTDEGYEVTSAANGQDALEQLAGDGARPDLILLDLVMPIMDGWSFREAQRRRPQLAGIPVVVLSASHPPDQGQLRSLDAQAFLAKPVGIERLVGALRRLAVVPPLPPPPRPVLSH